MKIKVYVDWDDNRILSQKQHLEEQSNDVKDLFEDDNLFEDFLFQNYSSTELYKMDDETKEEIRQDFLDYCQDKVEIDDVFDEVTLEI